MIFDLLVTEKGKSIVNQPLCARRMALQHFAKRFFPQRTTSPTRLQLSPANADFPAAQKWMREGAAQGWDGGVAKRLDYDYKSGERTGMVKVKRIRTADCVIGGFRWAHGAPGKAKAKKPGDAVGSLLLGLYNNRGELDHVGFSAGFSHQERSTLKSIVKPLISGPARNGPEDAASGSGGFTGKAPGGPSRWTRDQRETEWIPLKPRLVGEFQYDHFSGGRFRHGTKLLRWRPDKKPQQCTMGQLK
jgi:ATP-dependent DNA ligase